MIRLEDLNEAIAECQGQRDPNAQTCIKLAAFLTIKEAMFGDHEAAEQAPAQRGYSYASQPTADEPEIYVQFESGSEFAEAIDGKEADAAWQVMDELMGVLLATNKRLYDGVLRKIEQI